MSSSSSPWPSPRGGDAEVPRSFSTIQGTEEGDRAFRSAAMSFSEKKRRMPDPVNSHAAREGVRLFAANYRSRGNGVEFPTGAPYPIRSHLTYAIYALDATDEQVMAVCALREALGVSSLSMAGSITPNHLMVAAMAPGAQDSTLVRSLAGAVGSLTSHALLREWNGVKQALVELAGHEVSYYVRPGVKIRPPHITWAMNEGRGNSIAALRDARALRALSLSSIGEAYLSAIGRRNNLPLRSYILSRAGEMSDGELKAVEKGARTLLMPPSSRENKPLLPLEFLERLPTMDPRILGEFHALVEEYNLEWALASFDWNGGESSER